MDVQKSLQFQLIFPAHRQNYYVEYVLLVS